LDATTTAVEGISAQEARQLGLRGQGLCGPRIQGGVPGVLRALGAVQLDTISVLARSHELVPCARIGPVDKRSIEDAYWGQPAAAFEYHGHANCVFPLETWPYFAFRRRHLGQRPLPAASEPLYAEVRARLRDGPVTATDLGGARGGPGFWNWSAAKSAVEVLAIRGEAVCVTRKGWKRVYDLPERALPAEIRTQEPSDEECYRFLVGHAARALGVGTKRDIAEYFRLTARWGSPQTPRRLLDQAIDECGLVPVTVEGWKDAAFIHPAAMAEPAPPDHRPTLLSPFDSLIWDRARTERLFGFSLLLEAYKPKDQRVHGHFTMPLLAKGRLAARVDPAREGRTLVARRVSFEDPSAVEAMACALREAAAWVGCDSIRIDHVEPPTLAVDLRRAVS